MNRSMIGTLVACAALAAGLMPSFAQSYPTRPVKVVVPFAAGGPLDLVGRAVSEKLSASLKQPFVLENRTGAGGNIGTEAVAKAAPDGYTLLFVLSGTLTANPAMYRKLPFNVEKDLRPISMLVAQHADAGGASVAAGEHGRRVRRPRQETADRLCPCRTGQQRTSRDGIFPHHGGLRDRAGALSRQRTAGDRSRRRAGEGRLRLHRRRHPACPRRQAPGLAISSTKRSALAPDVPTTAEAGYPDFKLDTYFVLLAPAGHRMRSPICWSARCERC